MEFKTRIDQFLGAAPKVHPSAYIAPGATVIGDVTLAEESSVWFSAVLRGDINRIVVGPRSNIQDGAVVHLSDDFGTFIGELVTVGHKAVLHACTVGDEVLIGMGSIVLDGARVERNGFVGAGAVIAQGKVVGSGELWLGNPARCVRRLSEAEIGQLYYSAQHYLRLKDKYLGA